jgi:mevalonate kinase
MPVPKYESFSEEIEEIVWRDDCSYIDAVLTWCQENSIEPDSVGDIIKKNQAIKQALQVEAEELHFMPKESRLPI